MSTQPGDGFIASLIALQETLAVAAEDSERSLSTALPRALAQALAIVGCQDGRLILFEDALATPLIWAMKDGHLVAQTAEQRERILLEGVEKTVGETAAPAIVTFTPSPDTGHSPDSAEDPDASWSAMCVPLLDGQRVLGTLTALASGPQTFNLQERAQLILCAGLISQVVALSSARKEVETQAQRLVESDQLREELAAILVHDLRGPLGNIVASLEIANNAWTDDAPVDIQPMLEIAMHSSYQLRSLVDSILDISRLEAGHPLSERESVAVQQLVEEAVAIVQPELQVRVIEVVLELPREPLYVLVNPGMVRRVVLNLLDNALKASHSGQNIVIRVQGHSPQQLVLSVIDHGAGIPKQFRDRVFEKFQRLDGGGASKGLGLGLAFCRLAVKAHDGEIWVEDGPDGGACFSFTLPIIGVETS